MKSESYVNCASCEDKYICPHAARGNFCGTKNGETRPDFGKEGVEMRLTTSNKEFFKEHGLKINDAISKLAELERDAKERGATLFMKKRRER